jgi:hypothetical protein
VERAFWAPVKRLEVCQMKRCEGLRKKLQGLKAYKHVSGELVALALAITLLAAFVLPPVTPRDHQAYADNSMNDNSSDYFTIAVLPDTQFYSEWFPDIFKGQAQWIVNNQATLNIQFVCGLGDIVEHYNNTSEWQNAVAAYNILSNAGVPYSVVSGNHDDGAAQPTQQYFNAYFPTS